MYSNYSSPPPQFTNNPFSSATANAQARFPDISGSSSPGGYQDSNNYAGSQWNNGGMNGFGGGAGYSQMQPQQQPGMYNQQPPTFQQQPQPQFSTGYAAGGYNTGTPSPLPMQSGSGFQPSSSFGQQLSANISGSSYGYLNGGQQGGGYGQTPQQQQQLPGYLSQFDPYSGVSNGWDGQNQTQQPQQQQPQLQNPSTPSYNPLSGGKQHPREYIQQHKAELETWDDYSWKQAFNAFDILKDAWDKRKTDIDGNVSQLQAQLRYGGGGFHPSQLQQEIERLQQLRREAESNSDSVAASSFQMREVFSGYRQSTDVASKRRVRESSNAALQGLPDWPSAAY